MKLVKKKKLEIFIESTYEKNLLRTLKNNKVCTYACLPTEYYHGKQITSIEDDIIDILEFSMCVAIVSIDQHKKVIEDIRKILSRVNGVMYIQDIEEIESK